MLAAKGSFKVLLVDSVNDSDSNWQRNDFLNNFLSWSPLSVQFCFVQYLVLLISVWSIFRHSLSLVSLLLISRFPRPGAEELSPLVEAVVGRFTRSVVSSVDVVRVSLLD